MVEGFPVHTQLIKICNLDSVFAFNINRMAMAVVVVGMVVAIHYSDGLPTRKFIVEGGVQS